MMLATIWNGPASPKIRTRQLRSRWFANNYPRAYSIDDDETDSAEELPDEMTTYAEEPEVPLRHHLTMRHSYNSSS